MRFRSRLTVELVAILATTSLTANAAQKAFSNTATS